MVEILTYLLVPLLLILPVLFLLVSPNKKERPSSSSSNITLPKSYPLIGSYLATKDMGNRRVQWLSDIIQIAPAATYKLDGALGTRQIITGNPASVEHILKTRFTNYRKGKVFTETLSDFLGTGIFNTNGENWKFQRQVASHEFNTKSLRKFVEQVVDTELSNRLIPILSSSSSNEVLDFQDILQRFAFDNICKIAFGFDPEYLTASVERSKFAKAFEEATEISSKRFRFPLPVIWKMKRILNIGSEKRLRVAVNEVREFAKGIVREKKSVESSDEEDLLSRFLSSGHSDEDFVTDIVISFILAGKDTTSAALTWFFWLVWKNPKVEEEIVKEIREKSEAARVYDEVKEMVYTHAALSESMRLYPPVPMDSKEAINDDVLPDGTVVKKGTVVTYHVYAMGRMESIWGNDWAEFRPERWLEKDAAAAGKWKFVGRDSFSYPVFQAGPRICLGKEMAFLQMKRLVAGILSRFRVVPSPHLAQHPNFISFLTSQMEGGCPVTIHPRNP